MSKPEAGAECGSAARSDLCGGRPKPRGEGRPYRDRRSARKPSRGSTCVEGDGVRKVAYRDPDGNEFELGGAPSQKLFPTRSVLSNETSPTSRQRTAVWPETVRCQQSVKVPAGTV